MYKKLVLVFGLIVFLSHAGQAVASISITEILYSPTSGQWIELYNGGDSSVDISKYKILDSGAVKNGHGITVLGNFSIEPGSYAVVAKVPENLPSADFKSALNIKVSQDTVILRNELGEDIDSVIVDGSATGGNSIQLIDGSWAVSLPTPGQANVYSILEDEEETVEAESSQTSNKTTSKTPDKVSAVSVKTQKTKVQIKAPVIVHKGSAFTIEGTGTDTKGEKLSRGRYYWNLGDGSSREVKATITDKFSLIYFYSGEYKVLLQYFPDSFTEEPEATAEIIIKVIEPGVYISNTGTAGDFFVELSNKAGYPADISGWVLQSNLKIFTFPKNTILGANKKIIISPRVSGFDIGDKLTLRLMTREGNQVFEPQKEVVPVKTSAPRNIIEPEEIETEPFDLREEDVGNVFDLESTLPASVSGANIPQVKNSWLIIFTSVLFIGGAGTLVYFLRRIRAVPPGDDFEILDE